jgi:hypothetical protein
MGDGDLLDTFVHESSLCQMLGPDGELYLDPNQPSRVSTVRAVILNRMGSAKTVSATNCQLS